MCEPYSYRYTCMMYNHCVDIITILCEYNFYTKYYYVPIAIIISLLLQYFFPIDESYYDNILYWDFTFLNDIMYIT